CSRQGQTAPPLYAVTARRALPLQPPARAGPSNTVSPSMLAPSPASSLNHKTNRDGIPLSDSTQLHPALGKIREALAHRHGGFKQPATGAAGVDWQWSLV